MTTIAANNLPTGAALATLISSGSGAATPLIASGSTPRPLSSLGSAGLGPATVVDLSDNAKAVLTKAKSDQAVADRLAAKIAASKNTSKTGQTSTSPTFEQIVASAKQVQTTTSPKQGTAGETDQVDNVGIIQSGLGNAEKWIGIARQLQAGQEVQITPGRVPSDDESFQIAANLTLANKIISLQDSGQVDAAQALTSAFNNGTVNVQNAADVPSLNLQFQTVHFADAGGGGSSSTASWNPTGIAKAAIDSGHATWIGAGDRGAFYLSWVKSAFEL